MNKNISHFRSPAIYEPSAFFSATPQPTPLPSPTGSDQSGRRECETSPAFEFHNAVAGVNIPSKRLPSHRNDEVLTVGSVELDIQNSIDRKQKKTSKNNLDRPKLILTMPSISDDGYWNELDIKDLETMKYNLFKINHFLDLYRNRSTSNKTHYKDWKDWHRLRLEN